MFKMKSKAKNITDFDSHAISKTENRTYQDILNSSAVYGNKSFLFMARQCVSSINKSNNPWLLQ